MNFDQFVAAVDNYVFTHVLYWRSGDTTSARQALKTIYNDVCEQAVHNLATLQEQRDKALAMAHKLLTEER